MSLEESNPLDERVAAEDGTYRFERVPYGASLEVTASAPGFSARTRRVTSPLERGLVVSFGADPRDPGGSEAGLVPEPL